MIKTSLLALLTIAWPLGVCLAADKTHAHHGHDHGPPPPKEAVAIMMPFSGSKVEGEIRLTQQKKDVRVTGEVRNLTPGLHGFHIHEFGDLRSPDGMSVGGHYDPDKHPHGGPESAHHHAGDLGNIKANEQGIAKVDVLAKNLRLHFVVGRSLVVHADPDDLKSQHSGNSGPRVGVGVIGIAASQASKKR